MNKQAFLKIDTSLTETILTKTMKTMLTTYLPEYSPFAHDRIKAFFLGSTMFKKVVTDKLINTIITLTSQVNDCI